MSNYNIHESIQEISVINIIMRRLSSWWRNRQRLNYLVGPRQQVTVNHGVRLSCFSTRFWILLDCRRCNAMEVGSFLTLLKCNKHSIQNKIIFTIFYFTLKKLCKILRLLNFPKEACFHTLRGFYLHNFIDCCLFNQTL